MAVSNGIDDRTVIADQGHNGARIGQCPRAPRRVALMEHVAHVFRIFIAGSRETGFKTWAKAELLLELTGILCNNKDVSRREHIVGVEAVNNGTIGLPALHQNAHTGQMRQGRTLVLDLDEFIALCPRDLPIVVDLRYAKRQRQRWCRVWRRSGWGRLGGRPRRRQGRRGRCWRWSGGWHKVWLSLGRCRYDHPAIICTIRHTRNSRGPIGVIVVLIDNCAVEIEETNSAPLKYAKDGRCFLKDQERAWCDFSADRKLVRPVAGVFTDIQNPLAHVRRR